MTMPLKGLCNPNAKSSYGEPVYKKGSLYFSISHSGDILGVAENLNRSHDHNHTPFRNILSSLSWD